MPIRCSVLIQSHVNEPKHPVLSNETALDLPVLPLLIHRLEEQGTYESFDVLGLVDSDAVFVSVMAAHV
jgi:hypothetical protein